MEHLSVYMWEKMNAKQFDTLNTLNLLGDTSFLATRIVLIA